MAETRPLIVGWLAALEAERDRRAGRDPAAVEWLIAELEEMGRRLVAVSPSAGVPGDLELAEQMTQAKGWEQVDELRIPADLSPAEAVALVMVVNPKTAIRLLNEYVTRVADHRSDS
jgi:hypothetical protein